MSIASWPSAGRKSPLSAGPPAGDRPGHDVNASYRLRSKPSAGRELQHPARHGSSCAGLGRAGPRGDRRFRGLVGGARAGGGRRPAARSSRPGWPTRARRSLPGMPRIAGRSPPRSAGNAGARSRSSSVFVPRDWKGRSGSARACRSTRTTPPASWPGCSSTTKKCARRPPGSAALRDRGRLADRAFGRRRRTNGHIDCVEDATSGPWRAGLGSRPPRLVRDFRGNAAQTGRDGRRPRAARSSTVARRARVEGHGV